MSGYNFRNVQTLIVPISGVTANTVSAPIETDDYRNQEVTIIASGGSVGATIQVLGSDEENPDFTVASSATNSYAPICLVSLDTRSNVNGSTGVVLSAAGTSQYEVNCNLKKWMAVKVSGYSAGTITVKFKQCDNK